MSDTEQTSRIGINAVEAIFLEMGWIFREQPTSDFGVDAQAEIKVGKQATGRLIALQIKSGASYFKKRGENFVYYGSREHLDYWTNHSLPVFLKVVDVACGVMAQTYQVYIKTSGNLHRNFFRDEKFTQLVRESLSTRRSELKGVLL